MSTLAKQFIAGAFGLIAFYLLVANYSGAGKVIGALGQNGALVFKTLQGRG